MAKDDQEEAFEKALSANLARVIDWLKFAEAKNGALVAFDTAWTVAIANLLMRADAQPVAYQTVLPVAAGMFILSALVAVVALLPRWNLDRFFSKDDASMRDHNLIFYGDIVKVPLDKVAEQLRERYLPVDGRSASDLYLEDLSNQIAVNSDVACRKYRLFTHSARLAGLAILVVALPMIKATFCIAFAALASIF